MTGVLFDLDGVLLDSEDQYTEFWSGIDRMYPTGVPSFAKHIKGTTLEMILPYFPDPEVRADVMKRLELHQANMVYHAYPGVIRFLQELKARGIPRAIVTSSDSKKMEEVYRQIPGFRDYFDAVVDASQVTRSKPDPQGYLLGAEALGVAPEDCYVFEDSLQGLEAARRSGGKVIGVATTYTRQELAGRAPRIIDSVGEMTVDKMLQS
ncbi:MAG: HAD family hydrolase [Bacteroidales bacterium]|nr:HAD family hydrolase [Bacteroidales bacterium]